MKEERLQRLLDSARNERAPSPPDGFALRVMRAIGREEQPEPVTLFGQIGDLFPRLALGATVVIGLCVAVDVGLSILAQADLATGVAEISEHWLFAVR